MAERRFGNVLSNENIDKLLHDAMNENTKRSSALWVRVVTAFRKEKELSIVFADCSATELDGFLCQFYAAMRPKKPGVEHSRSSCTWLLEPLFSVIYVF